MNNKDFHFKDKTYVMGILNVTPDSFSDGGLYNQKENALQRARDMIEQGADMIDVGGESTRPGSTKVEGEEERRRVIPVLKELSAHLTVPLSIDTYKAETARAALEAGADIINDVRGAKADPEMAGVAACYDAPIILMHNRENTDYNDVMKDMIADIEESIEICRSAGVRKDRIILDPGIGFAKTYDQNLEVMRRLEEFTALDYPVLLGTSRKSLVSKTLDLPASDRVEGTGATISLGIERGADIVRVHDVLEMSRTVKMMDAMLGKGKVTTVG
ncbi:dihydropteroate synthase [Salibacterium qingdaonense]|uniref:Dihydropteroate synthase n=1 Tax=Salibacterium qingdaonense TaxID=266892 RepID=A0A1I4PSK6_9BACI|nr:dihydropteroate synthase [Salibacterium qingdaonense]SFM30748.1 Dihydropteroate synthase [Salibacterium qingdaonense]